MPSPTTALTTLRPDLASFLEYDLESDRAGYIASKVFPVIDVASQAGVFGIIPVEQLLQQRATNRAPGSGYSRGNFTFQTSTYACEEHGAEEPVDDRQAKMYREYFDAEQVSTMRAFSAVLRNAEQRVADALYDTSVWTGASLTTTLTNEWDDVTAATPITDIDAARKKIYDGSGLWANCLIINKKQFYNLRRLDQVIEAITSQGAGDAAKQSDVTEAMLARVFDLDMVLVAGASRNSAKEGQTATPVQIWSDEYVMLAKVATSADMAEPCVGRMFHWSEDGSSIGGTVESYRDEVVRANIIRVRHDVDEVVLYPQAAHLFSNVTT